MMVFGWWLSLGYSRDLWLRSNPFYLPRHQKDSEHPPFMISPQEVKGYLMDAFLLRVILLWAKSLFRRLEPEQLNHLVGVIDSISHESSLARLLHIIPHKILDAVLVFIQLNEFTCLKPNLDQRLCLPYPCLTVQHHAKFPLGIDCNGSDQRSKRLAIRWKFPSAYLHRGLPNKHRMSTKR